jgi:hypothetical protein
MAFAMSGCILRKRAAIPWASAVQVRPVVEPRPAVDGADLEVPEFNLDLEPLAALLVPVRMAPPRPHVPPPPSPSPAAPVPAEGKPPAPTIAPQLSQAEFAAAQQETNQSLDIAEKNLAAASGRTLNAAQNDLVSKIKAFLKDAREAARAGDWLLARNLAKKAQVLSEELLHSV